MKKKLGVLVLVLSPLVISPACASSNGSSRPNPQQPESGENWARTEAPALQTNRPSDPAASQEER